jgi:release factor glutamine methyltransferase
VAQVLQTAGVVHAHQEARWIVQAALGSDGYELLHGTRVTSDVERRVQELARRRASGEPLQYVCGLAGFRHLELKVGPGVFIPRPETELVAALAMERLPTGGTAVELGTGSGAIALAIATERPDARVFATESSTDALAYARHNQAAIGANVTLVGGDLFAGLPTELVARVDVVVSNPPYVPLRERALLPRDVIDHEPWGALFAGDDGLAVIRRIAAESRAWLREGGWLVLEVGDRQGELVRDLLGAASYREMSVRRDLAGRERIVEGRR